MKRRYLRPVAQKFCSRMHTVERKPYIHTHRDLHRQTLVGHCSQPANLPDVHQRETGLAWGVALPGMDTRYQHTTNHMTLANGTVSGRKAGSVYTIFQNRGNQTSVAQRCSFTWESYQKGGSGSSHIRTLPSPGQGAVGWRRGWGSGLAGTRAFAL